MRICKFKPLKSKKDVKYIEELMDGIFHLSDWTNLNDIWEGVYKIDAVARSASESRGPVGAKLYSLKKRFGTYSFSIEGRGCDDILRNHCMWAHYASNHCGIAVEYEIPDSLCEDWTGLRREGYCFTKIAYLPKPKMLTMKDIGDAENDVDGQRLFDLARTLLSEKINDWQGEKEVRLIALDDCSKVKQRTDNSGLKHLYFHSDLPPRRIITGSRYFTNDEKLKRMFEDACKRHEITPIGISALEEYQESFLSEEDYDAFEGFFSHS